VMHLAPRTPVTPPAPRTSRPYNPAVHRFFAPSLDPGDETVVLPRQEAEHLTRVLRLGVGDTVAVFDGRGHEFVARIASALRRDVRAQIVSRVEPAAESSVAMTLAQAVLKGDKMDEVIRDAVMLGAYAIQPIVTKRSETTVAALMRGARLERWRRVALASVKQSRRAVLPEIRMPLTLDIALGEPAGGLRMMFVEPAADTGVEPIATLQGPPAPLDATLFVGPEGGWAPEEWTLASAHGVRLISLGPRTLRADAVPIAALSVLQFIWRET
jgi:16S rRNA (uracil1498-N3)-methyltransferase